MGQGPLKRTDPLLTAASKDAAEAVKAGLAEGHYAAGRIAEELGQWNVAITSYRKAMTAHPALDADGSRYRIALARVLSQAGEARPAGLPAPIPNAGGDKVGGRDPARTREEKKLLALMMVLGLQAPGLPDEQASWDEAEKLADAVLNSPADKVPFNVRRRRWPSRAAGRWRCKPMSRACGRSCRASTATACCTWSSTIRV